MLELYPSRVIKLIVLDAESLGRKYIRHTRLQ